MSHNLIKVEMSNPNNKINIKKMSKRTTVVSSTTTCHTKTENGLETMRKITLNVTENAPENDRRKHNAKFPLLCANCKKFLVRGDIIWKKENNCICQDCKQKIPLKGDWKRLEIMNNNGHKKPSKDEKMKEMSNFIKVVLQGDKVYDDEVRNMKKTILDLCDNDEHAVLSHLMMLAYEWIIEKKKHLTAFITQTDATIDESKCHLKLLQSQFLNLDNVAKRLQPIIEPLQKHMDFYSLTLTSYLRYLFKKYIGQDEKVKSFLKNSEKCGSDALENLSKEFSNVMKEREKICEELFEKNPDSSERFSVNGVKENIFNEDVEFFRQQRKLLVKKSGNRKENPNKVKLMEEELRNVLNGHTPNQTCPHCCKIRECCCMECCITHFITCGLIDHNSKCCSSAQSFMSDLDNIKPPSMSSASSASDYESTVEHITSEECEFRCSEKIGGFSFDGESISEYYVTSSSPASPEPELEHHDYTCKYPCSMKSATEKLTNLSISQSSNSSKSQTLYKLHSTTEATFCSNCGQNNISDDSNSSCSENCTDMHNHQQNNKTNDDDEDDDDDDNLEDCGGDQCEKQQGKFCDCCYCEFFGHSNPGMPPVSKNYVEMRDKLRQRLKKKKEKKSERHNQSITNNVKKDEPNVDDLVAFIKGEESNREKNSSKSQKRAKQKQKKLEEKAKKQNSQNSIEASKCSSASNNCNIKVNDSPVTATTISNNKTSTTNSATMTPTDFPSEFQLQINSNGELHFVSPTRGERKVAVAKRKHPERQTCGLLRQSGLTELFDAMKRSYTGDASTNTTSAQIALTFNSDLPNDSDESNFLSPLLENEKNLTQKDEKFNKSEKNKRDKSSKKRENCNGNIVVTNNNVSVNGDLKSNKKNEKISPKSDVKKKKNKNKTDSTDDFLEVFTPKLDPDELDDAEREVEQFKQFCQQSSSIKPESRKKINIHFKESVGLKRK